MSVILGQYGVTFPDSTQQYTAALQAGSQGLFAFGVPQYGTYTNITNKVTHYGLVSSNQSGVGTARYLAAGASYGVTKGIIAFGRFGNSGSNIFNASNLINEVGTISTDQTGVGTNREELACASYGYDMAMFRGGQTAGGPVNTVNLVSNAGVVASDSSGITSYAIRDATAVTYGYSKALFAFGLGYVPSFASWQGYSFVSDTGVIGSDTTTTNSPRDYGMGATYGGDKGIIYGGNYGSFNGQTLISNTGVMATDATIVGTSRYWGAGTSLAGGSIAIFGYGVTNVASTAVSMTNLVSNTGVVSNDVTGVGTARYGLSATHYG